MTRLLCRIGLHRWSKWDGRTHVCNGKSFYVIQRRECTCGARQVREIPA